MKEYNAQVNVNKFEDIQAKDLRNVRTICRIFIPYQLNVNPDVAFQLRLPNSEKIHTLQVISRSLYLADFNYELFGLTYEEDFKRNILQTRTGDRLGKTGHSKLEIIIDKFINIFDKHDVITFDTITKLLEKCCEIYNYFLDRYAAVTRHRQLNKISYFDLHTIEVLYQDREDMSFKIQTSVSSIHGVTLMNNFVIPPEEVQDRLKVLLLDNTHSVDSIGVNAVRSLFSGDYLNGIVQAVTQLEAFLYMLFEKTFGEKEIKNTENKLMSLGLTNLIDMLNLVLTVEEYQLITASCDLTLIKTAVTSRNKFIHKGENAAGIVSFEQAEKIVDTINNFCTIVSTICGTDHMLDEKKLGWPTST